MVSSVVILLGKNYSNVWKAISAISLGIFGIGFFKNYKKGRDMGKDLAKCGVTYDTVKSWRKQYCSKK